MRFMLIVKATGYSEAGVNHSREHSDARIAYKKSLSKAGALLAAEELQPSSTGIRISYPSHGGDPEVQAGPFPPDQELIAEYTLIDVGTEDEALNWALRMPVPAGRGECEIELRRLEENSDSLREPRLQALEADLQDQLNMLKKI
ncbi:YciI family protein [Paenibacillus solisilvae]|uniref:YciI family protein n=1 Tax=Paenibacillus solisilvae TaxID=2486751 RepID=A0ABW0W166_9BACL